MTKENTKPNKPKFSEVGESGDIIAMEVGDIIMGKFCRIYLTEVKNQPRTVLAIQEEGKDEPTGVWSSTDLTKKFADMQEGSLVRVTYKEDRTYEENGEAKNYKIFKVEVAE